jgi:hypothetical protein
MLAILVAIFLQSGISLAAGEDDCARPPEPPRSKLTLAHYDFSSGITGEDVNVRHTFNTSSACKASTAWIGAYHQSDRFDQLRVGYEYDYRTGWLTVRPSVQAATHRFVGASIYGEAGSRFFAIGGAGRTNLEPYWNLGFDPNDYVQAGAGYRALTGYTLSASAIHDNRLGTGQTNTHLSFRCFLPDEWRLTVDVVNEHGNGDEGLAVRSWSVSIDMEGRRWFARVANDPHVNYTPDRQLRIAGGLRF